MTYLYSLYVESLTKPIPKDRAKEICNLAQKYYYTKFLIFWKCSCHCCYGNGFKDGNNNRGRSLINQIYDKLY